MAPLLDKSSVKKCHNETVDSKQNRIPFRWLLKKSKSSKSAKEMAQAENPQVTTVPTSKSCDSGITGLNAIDKCSSFLLWRLLPPRGNSTHCDRLDKKGTKSPSKSVKTSFSCGDVYGLLSANKTPFGAATRSSQDISMGAEHPEESHPFCSSQSSNRLTHSQSTRQLSETVSSHEDLNQRSFLPEICHMVFCKLCLTLVPAEKIYCLEDCGCIFCFPCMQQYLLVNIKEGNVVITCPDANCGFQGKVLIYEVHDLVGDEAFFKYQRFKLNRDVELDPERAWCPTAGCETICKVRPLPIPGEGIPVSCHNCDLMFCSLCKIRWHSGKTCAELRNDEEELPISDDEGSLIKRCPNCQVLIERDEGCAQMMCKRCKHVFCWHCLASLDDDFLLRHYDKGPCRNKLGHSRASMIWHRTQVVGIFAGFSFLLLVASPLLLLAAPCLLCCRCRNCKFFYEEPTPL